MDTITHGLIGTLGSRTGYYQKFGRLATISFLLGSIFPDIDVVVAIFGPDFTMRYHRGITHSLVAAPIFSIVVMYLVSLILRTREYMKIYPMVLIGMFSHIFFDLITAYGTVLFDPFSLKRYSWNIVFILDPFITIPLIIGLLISIKRRHLALRTSLFIFAFLSLYLLFSYQIKKYNTGNLNNLAQKHNIDVVRLNLYPRPLAPIRWLGIIESKDHFYKVYINSVVSEDVVINRYSKSDKNPYVDAAKSHRVARLYHWFADFPVARYKRNRLEHIVEFHDLRFRMLSRRTPFTLKYIFDRSNKIKEITLGGRKVKGL